MAENYKDLKVIFSKDQYYSKHYNVSSCAALVRKGPY